MSSDVVRDGTPVAKRAIVAVAVEEILSVEMRKVLGHFAAWRRWWWRTGVGDCQDTTRHRFEGAHVLDRDKERTAAQGALFWAGDYQG